MSQAASAPSPLFTVTNHHVPDSGRPPQIDGDQPGYHGYFENLYGEQFILYIPRPETPDLRPMGTLWCGDAGWEHPYQVVEGVAIGLIMGKEEIAWLQACWLAAVPQ